MRVVNGNESQQTLELLDRVATGSESAIESLLRLHKPYLDRLVSLRIDPELLSRVDPSDIVQETQLAIVQRLHEFIERRPCSYRIWIRQTALERLVDQRRRHVFAKKRSVRRERESLDSSLAIARQLFTETPSEIVRSDELREQVREIIDGLAERDREILTLRHAEGLSTAEAADLLGITTNTTRQRYGRALVRLHQRLLEHGIGVDDTSG